MRTAILLSCLLLAMGGDALAQRAPARTGMAVTVTDPIGATLPDIEVEVLGASDRHGRTDESGQIAFTGLQAGTYRLRFSGDVVIPFEREIVVRAGQTAEVDVTLNPAPAPLEPPPSEEAPLPEEPPLPPVGPPGSPQALSIIDLVERELISGNEPRRETLVACSGNTRSLLVQLNQAQAERLYDAAEVGYYVVAGEGTVRVEGRNSVLSAGSFVSLPRGTIHSLARQGRRPLIVLATISGLPCETPR